MTAIAAALKLFPGETMGARVYRCYGQMVVAGRKTTRGCGRGHIQPCPGGPLVFEITRTSGVGGLVFNCIESSGDSWREALDKVIQHRKEDNERYQALKTPKKRR